MVVVRRRRVRERKMRERMKRWGLVLDCLTAIFLASYFIEY